MLAHRLLPPALLLSALTIAVFLPVAHNGFVSFDDDLYLTDNPAVQEGLTLEGLRWAFTTHRGGNWHPLTWLSHMLDVQLFGLAPGSHHLVGLAVHTLAAVALFLLAATMTGALWRSFLVAALFAIHPLHVESVAWAAERKDLLAGLLWFLASGAYLAYARRPGPRRLTLVYALFALGLLAKPVLVTLPFTLLLLDFWPLGRLGAGWRLLLGEKGPLFVLSAASSLATYVVQREQGAMAGPLLPLADRLANAVLSYAAYLGKAFYPRDLAVFYPFRGDWSILAVLCGTLLLAGLTAAFVRAARRLPFLAMGWFWYLGTLVPMIGLVQVGGQAMADRYTYLPLTGIFIAVAFALGETASRTRRATVAASAAAVVVLALVARAQVLVWRDDVTLYRHALSHTRANHVALTNLGHALSLAGQFEEALAAYVESSRLQPREWRPHLGRADVLARLGRLEDAERAVRTALELNPDFSEARNFLGLLLLRQERPEEARREFLAALELDPASADPLNNLGTIALSSRRPAEAEQWFRRALEARRSFPEALNGLAIALVRQGRVAEALPRLREALRLRPDYPDARANLEQALRLPVPAPWPEPGRRQR